MELHWIIAIGMMLLVPFIIFMQIRKSKCPLCGKYLKIKTTGRTNLETYTKQESEYVPEKKFTRYYTSTYQKYISHYKCSACGYTYDERNEELLDKKSRVV